MNITELAKHLLPFKILLEGGILSKTLKNETKIYLFLEIYENGVKELCARYSDAESALKDVLINPSEWKVENHKMSYGHPYPWSVSYKENLENHGNINK